MDPSVWIVIAGSAFLVYIGGWRHGRRLGYREGYEAGKEWSESRQVPRG